MPPLHPCPGGSCFSGRPDDPIGGQPAQKAHQHPALLPIESQTGVLSTMCEAVEGCLAFRLCRRMHRRWLHCNAPSAPHYRQRYELDIATGGGPYLTVFRVTALQNDRRSSRFSLSRGLRPRSRGPPPARRRRPLHRCTVAPLMEGITLHPPPRRGRGCTVARLSGEITLPISPAGPAGE